MNKETFELVQGFFDRQLWRKISSMDFFAAELSDGRIGYCTLTGGNGNHIGFCMYIGEEGISSLRNALAVLETDFRKLSADNTFYMHDTCSLQCYLENLSNIPEACRNRIVGFYRENGIPIDMDEKVPFLCVWDRRRIPWLVNGEQEKDLILGLKAACWFGDHFPEDGSNRMKIPFKEEIPLLKQENGTWKVLKTILPDTKEEIRISPALPDLTLMDFIRQKKTEKGAVLYVSMRVADFKIEEGVSPEDPTPYCPILLMVMKGGYLLKCIVSSGITQADHDGMLEDFAELLADLKKKPERIIADGRIAEETIAPFCRITGIELACQQPVPELDEAFAAMKYGLDNPDEMVNAFLEEVKQSPAYAQLEESLLKGVPKNKRDDVLRAMIYEMLEEGSDLFGDD